MSRKKNNKNTIKKWGQAFVLALLLALILRGFIFQSYYVSNHTMEKTIPSGDFVIVNKLKYGARMPITLLSFPFVSNWYSPIIQLPYMRIPAIKDIQRNDFVLMNYPGEFDPPIDKRRKMLKRCVALPGDQLQIKNKKVLINNQELAAPETALFNYRLVTDGSLLSIDFIKKYEITDGGLVSDIGIYDFPLSRNDVDLIKGESEIRYIRELKHFFGENTGNIFPEGRYHRFNKDYYGKIVIPYKGMRIDLHAKNIEFYKVLIEHYEKNELVVRNNRVYINGLETETYTVKDNYYFVLDDNRDYAKDSRYFGYVPESHIIGKATLSWFSYDKLKGEIRWDRIFRKL